QLVTQHERVRGAVHQLDLRSVDHDGGGAAGGNLDGAGVHLDAVVVAVGDLDGAGVVVEHDLVPALGFEDLAAGRRGLRNGSGRVTGAGTNRVARSAALELVPSAGPHVGDGEQALPPGSPVDEGRQGPAGFLAAEQPRNLGLHASEIVGVLVVCHLAAILTE